VDDGATEIVGCLMAAASAHVCCVVDGLAWFEGSVCGACDGTVCGIATRAGTAVMLGGTRVGEASAAAVAAAAAAVGLTV